MMYTVRIRYELDPERGDSDFVIERTIEGDDLDAETAVAMAAMANARMVDCVGYRIHAATCEDVGD